MELIECGDTDGSRYRPKVRHHFVEVRPIVTHEPDVRPVVRVASQDLHEALSMNEHALGCPRFLGCLLPAPGRLKCPHRKREESGTHFRREADCSRPRQSSPPEDLLVARIGRLERGVDFVGPAEDVQEVLRDKRRAIVAHDRRKLAKNGLSKSGGLREDLNARIGLRPGRHLTDRACAPRMTP
jgi:hypothetical protein